MFVFNRKKKFFWGGRWNMEYLGSVGKGGGLRVDFEEGITSRTTEMFEIFVWATTQGNFVAWKLTTKIEDSKS